MMRIIRAFVLISFLLFTAAFATAQELSFVVPKGSKYSVLSNEDNSGRTIIIHPNGDVWIASGNKLRCDTKSIELPSRFNPGSLNWTNSGKLVLYYHDTIYVLDDSQILRPLAIVESYGVIIQPYGDSNFAFCAVGDTVIYTCEMKTKRIEKILSCSKPIMDFIVDSEDVYYATENRVVAYLKEKQYVPIFINTNSIRSIAFCGSKAMLFSDIEGLWIVDVDRNKSAICSHPIVDIVTDSRDCGFFKTIDGSWLFVSQISNYLK